MARKKKKKEDSFEFHIEFTRPSATRSLNIEIEKWTFAEKKRTGTKVPVIGYGIDGLLYNGTAHILKTGEVKKVKVDSNSGRWE